MFFLIGKRRGGVLIDTPSARIETEFLHVLGLPVLHLGSFSVCDGRERPIPLHARSTQLGYVRTWLPLLVVAVFFLPVWPGVNVGFGDAPLPTIVWVIGLFSWIITWLLAGPPPVEPPSPLHEACSYAYGRVIGLPHDPTVLGLDLSELRKMLRAELERSAALEPTSYRAAPELGLEWAKTFVAHEPDLDATARALTLARLEVAATEKTGDLPPHARALASFEHVRDYFERQHSARIVEIERQRRSIIVG